MVRKELESGGRVFIVYPIIDESEDLPNLKAATTDFTRIIEEFKGYNCGLVHGKLKPNEKEEAMEDFKSGRTQVLVATTVIEVGIDIVEASMMVIMHAERYGMAQLHQLRGRVGRGIRKSTCLLLTSSSTSLERVKVLEECNDACKKEFLFLPNKKAYEGYQKRKRAPRLLIIFLDEETR